MASEAPPRAVVFDFGGVLADMRWELARALEDDHQLPRGAVWETLYRTPTWAAIERGHGEPAAWLAEAHRLLEERAGRALPPLHQTWRAAQALIDENVALARGLRPRYRTAVLSNADRSLRDRLRTAGIHDLFDLIVSSAEEGLAKPEPAIYRLASERLGVPIEACLFVDDLERNVTAAVQAGMRAIHYRRHRGDDLRALLAERGVRADPEEP